MLTNEAVTEEVLAPVSEDTQDDQGGASNSEQQINQAADEASNQDDEGELVISVGDEQIQTEDPEKTEAPTWVKELRKANREKERKIRELESKLAASNKDPQYEVVEAGKEPEIDDYETWTDDGKARFKADWAAWNEKKIKAEAVARQKEEAEQKSREQWNAKLTAYSASKLSLKVPDFEDAEEAVLRTLNVVQQGLIVQGAKKPALLVYALGKNPEKAKSLASISDPVEFAFAAGEFMSEIKVQSRRPNTKPEATIPKSGMSGSSAVDSELAKLQAEADRTGDRTHVARYLRGKSQQS